MPSSARRRTVRVRFTGALLASLATLACHESTGLPDPASIAVGGTVVAEGTAGFAMTAPPTFVVKDADGNALSGVKFNIAVTAGGGTLTDTPGSTKSDGTSVGTWKLGTVAGVNSVTITVGGLPVFVISVNGIAGPPASIVFVSG
ncbi:MAG: hypothetical protein ABI556_13045, partial [Gemmatimonadales bacterium]